HARYALPCRSEPAIAGCGNRPGTDVTGMRRDQRFRYGGDRSGSGAAEELADLSPELGGGSRVEQSGDGGGADGGQAWASNKMLPTLSQSRSSRSCKLRLRAVFSLCNRNSQVLISRRGTGTGSPMVGSNATSALAFANCTRASGGYASCVRAPAMQWCSR